MSKLPKIPKMGKRPVPPQGKGFKSGKMLDPQAAFRGSLTAGQVTRGPVGGKSGKGQSQF